MRTPLRVAAWLGAALTLAACATGGPAAPADTVAVTRSSPGGDGASDQAYGSWEPIARSPLSGRNVPRMVWTGSEVLVLGGLDYECDAEPTALHCPWLDGGWFDPSSAREGAAYDPVTDSWRRIADAPAPISITSSRLLDGIVYALAIGGEGKTLLAYDVKRDRWSELPGPLASEEWSGDFWMVAAGGHLVVYRVANDPATLQFGPDKDGHDLMLRPHGYLHAAAGKVITASYYGDTLDGHRVGGVLDPAEGWSRLPKRPVSAVERETVKEFGRLGAEDPFPATWKGRIAKFHWLNVSGDEFVIAGRWAYDAAAGAWQLLPMDKGPVFQLQSSAVWAGDRVFVWGGSKGGDNTDHIFTGWIWKPLRSSAERPADTEPSAGDGGLGGSGGEGASG